MNSLLTWISVHSVLNSAPNVVYPNFEVKGSTPPWQHELLAEFYTQPGRNPGHDAVNFYEVFHNYLTATPGWVDILRWFGSLGGLVLWYTAESLEFMYVKLFGLLRISNISDYAAKAQYMGGHFGIHDLFVSANDFGLIVFSIVLLVYVIGTIINSPTYERYKNILRNTVLILFFLFCLPFMTSEFGQGVNDVAQGMFGSQIARTSATSNDASSTAHESSLANLAFYNNTVSIPTRIESTIPGQSIFDGTDSRGEIYQLGGSSQSASPIQGLDSNADPVMIDLTEMSFTQKDRWNGLADESIPQFLLDYAAPSESMDTNSLSMYANTASQIMAKKKQPGVNSSGKAALHNTYERNAESPLQAGSGTNTDISGHPGVSKAINLFNEVNPVDIGWRIGNSFGADMTQDGYEQNFKTLFEYHVADAGPGIGESSAAKGLTSHDVGNFDSSISKVFARSYNFYHVSWMAVYAQLVMLILILGEYTIKIFQMMFKLVVMYISSGLILLRNADNYQRIKNWMRDLFSIYEMAIMDVIMVYVSLYIIYPGYHEFDDHILVTTNNAYLANPYSITLLNLIGDLALLGCAAKGLNAVDRAVGSSGGGANTGTSGIFKSAIALTAAHGAEQAGSSIVRGAWGLGKSGVKGAWKKGKAGITANLSGRRNGAKHALDDVKKDNKNNNNPADTSNRKKNNPGLNADQKNKNSNDSKNMSNAAKNDKAKKGLNQNSQNSKNAGKNSNGNKNSKMGNATKARTGKKGLTNSPSGKSSDSSNPSSSDNADSNAGGITGDNDDSSDDGSDITPDDSNDDSGSDEDDDSSDVADDSGDDDSGDTSDGSNTAKSQYAQEHGQAAAEAAFGYNSAASAYGKQHGIVNQAQAFGDHQSDGHGMNADTSNGVTVFSPQGTNTDTTGSHHGPTPPKGGLNNNGGPNGPTNNGGSHNFINSSNPTGQFGGSQDYSSIGGAQNYSTNGGYQDYSNNGSSDNSTNTGGFEPTSQNITDNTDNGGDGITQNYDNGLNQGQDFHGYDGNAGGITNGGTTPNDYGGFQPYDDNGGDAPSAPAANPAPVNNGGGFQPNANMTQINHHMGYEAPSLPREGSNPATSKVVNNYDIPVHHGEDGHLHDDLGHVFTKHQAYGHPLNAQASLRPRH